MKVKITFTDELLGTKPSNPEIMRDYVASLAPDAKTIEEEVASVGSEAVVENAKTVFPRNGSGEPYLNAYQVKGFFKDACSMLTRVPDTKSGKLKAFRKIIDGLVFVGPDKLMLNLPEGAKLGECQRPLRASTPQGERVALVCSESAPAGTEVTFEITLLDGRLEPVVEEWLNYGSLRGFCQWRNSGKGRFTWKLV